MMEQRIQEYSAIINEQKYTIHSMTPSIIAKHWVKIKNQEMCGGHMDGQLNVTN